jgi:hypothetical protein
LLCFAGIDRIECLVPKSASFLSFYGPGEVVILQPVVQTAQSDYGKFPSNVAKSWTRNTEDTVKVQAFDIVYLQHF